VQGPSRWRDYFNARVNLFIWSASVCQQRRTRFFFTIGNFQTQARVSLSGVLVLRLHDVGGAADILRRAIFWGTLVKRIIFSAAAIFAVATTAHAGELSDIQEQSKQLREQNLALTKRIADLERRQRKLEAQPVKQPAIATRPTNPGDSMAADLAYKADYKMAPVDDSLTWHGITLYGLVDMGVTYQNHGAPLSNTAGLGLNYLISKNSNGSYFGVGPNALSSSFVGLKGNQEIADGLSAVFNLQTGFNPQSGKLSDGIGSIVQNNGLPIGMQNSFADSSKDGQAFNVAAYAGLSSPTYGTLTYGRQNALTSDGVINYDPMSNSGAFSLIGFQGATGGAGDTENRIFDNSFKYAVNIGLFRAAVETQIRSGAFSAPGNAIEGQIGGDYAGLSVDAIFSHVTDAVSSAPLSIAQIKTAAALGIDQGAGLVSGTVSDNTSFMLLAKYTYGPVKFFSGYEHMQFANPRDPLAPGSFITGGYSLGAANNTNFTTEKILQVFWGGVKYAVRPDLDLSIAYYHEEQNSFEGGTPATANLAHCTNSSLAQCSGQLAAVSFVADYRFAKRFDAYAGIMWSQVSNGLSNGFLQRSSIDPTVGLRFQF
jgi:predicted porin